MNTKELGRWRKLWTKPSPSWEMLPAGARGLGDELLRYCDEAGHIPLMGLAPPVAVARILRAHVSERRWIVAMLERLTADGFVRAEGDALVIRNFVTAQSAVTESGERMRAKRDRDEADERPADDRCATGVRLVNDRRTTDARQDTKATPRNSVGGRVTVTPSEERRGEKTPPNPLAGAEGGAGEDDGPPRLPSQEPSAPPPSRLDWIEVEDTLCRASRGTIDPSGGAQMRAKLLRLLGELGCSLADVDALGRFCAARPPTFPRWASHHRTLNLGHLLTEKLAEGSGLADLVSNARAWAKAEAAKPPTPGGPKGPRTVPGAARTEAEAAEGARLLAEGRRGPAARALTPAPAAPAAPFAKAVGQ